MKKNIFSIAVIILGILFLLTPAKRARADFQITDCLSVTGYLAYELGVNTGPRNPNNGQDGRNDFTLSRTFFQTEWTYKPSSKFKIFAKIRLTGDQTDAIDDEIGSYDAFPVDVPKYDWTMMKVSDDEWRAEVWELYADITIKNLWLRLGKQQIVWGEMIASRTMDLINPIDQSWNFLFEPEEFENIRIPTWMLRASYTFPGKLIPKITDLFIEGFLNPGDVLPNFSGDFGAPFNLAPALPFIRYHTKNNRGKLEYGIRMGGMIGDFYGTINYIHVYHDTSVSVMTGLVPDPVYGIPIFAPRDFTRYAILQDKRFPETDIVGATANFYIPPLNTVATFEGAWTSNFPYKDANNSFDIRDQGTWNWALRLQRTTFVLPHPSDAASIQLQFSQTVREGDNRKIVDVLGRTIDKNQEMLTLLASQTFFHATLKVGLTVVYDTDDTTYTKPSITYKWGDHWIFDLWGVFLQGREKRVGRFASVPYMRQVLGRVKYQF